MYICTHKLFHKNVHIRLSESISEAATEELKAKVNKCHHKPKSQKKFLSR